MNMSNRSISANLTYETVQRIVAFQAKNNIRHFADAVQGYISSLEAAKVDSGPWGSRIVGKIFGR